jgi:hypothetical protein
MDALIRGRGQKRGSEYTKAQRCDADAFRVDLQGEDHWIFGMRKPKELEIKNGGVECDELRGRSGCKAKRVRL